MDDELVQVKITTRTGQTAAFSASALEKTPGGYRFISYPEKRGYKKMIVVKDDAIATISIEAPEQFFDSFKDEPERTNPYPGGDPTTYVSPLKVVRDEARAKPLQTKDGMPVPMSAVKLDGKEVVVTAGMIGGAPK